MELVDKKDCAWQVFFKQDNFTLKDLLSLREISKKWCLYVNESYLFRVNQRLSEFKRNFLLTLPEDKKEDLHYIDRMFTMKVQAFHFRSAVIKGYFSGCSKEYTAKRPFDGDNLVEGTVCDMGDLTHFRKLLKRPRTEDGDIRDNPCVMERLFEVYGVPSEEEEEIMFILNRREEYELQHDLQYVVSTDELNREYWDAIGDVVAETEEDFKKFPELFPNRNKDGL